MDALSAHISFTGLVVLALDPVELRLHKTGLTDRGASATHELCSLLKKNELRLDNMPLAPAVEGASRAIGVLRSFHA